MNEGINYLYNKISYNLKLEIIPPAETSPEYLTIAVILNNNLFNKYKNYVHLSLDYLFQSTKCAYNIFDNIGELIHELKTNISNKSLKLRIDNSDLQIDFELNLSGKTKKFYFKIPKEVQEIDKKDFEKIVENLIAKHLETENISQVKINDLEKTINNLTKEKQDLEEKLKSMNLVNNTTEESTLNRSIDYEEEILNILNIGLRLDKDYPKVAENLYRIVLDISPNNIVANENLGFLLVDLKQFDEAEEFFVIALELNPSISDYYNNLGIIYAEQERYSEAEASFSKAISLDTKNSSSYNNLGYLFKGLFINLLFEYLLLLY